MAFNEKLLKTNDNTLNPTTNKFQHDGQEKLQTLQVLQEKKKTHFSVDDLNYREKYFFKKSETNTESATDHDPV